MPTYNFWVNPSTGNNANAGTEEAPLQTLRHACYDKLIGSWGPDVIVNVKVVPGVNLIANDRIRLWPQHLGATINVDSTTSSPWTFTNNYTTLIETNPAAVVTLNVRNGSGSRNQFIMWSNTETAGRNYHITLEDCTLTHDRDNVEIGCWIRGTTAGNGSVTFRRCTITGWDRPYFIELGALDAVTFEDSTTSSSVANASTGAISTIAAAEVTMSGSTFSMANGAVANRIDINATTGITIEDSTFDIYSTGSIGVWIRTLTGGSATIDASVTNSQFSATVANGGYVCYVGRDITTTSTRAANEAAGANFQSLLINGNDFVQRNLDAGTLGLFVDTNDAVLTNNYFRVGTLGNTTNVHQIYLWGRRILFENNLAVCAVLAFGPEQKIINNFILSNHQGILLGGTQGGSTTSGGGNNYTITNNLIAAWAFQCYSDYAYLGAYPTNLGTLVADINYNQYVVLNTATGIVRLTNTDLTATTMPQLRNVWQNSALTGSGSVWGDASNSDNDSHSRLEDGSRLSGIVVQSASLSRAQLQSIKDSYRVVLKVGNSEILKVYKGSTELPKIAFGPNRKWLSV